MVNKVCIIAEAGVNHNGSLSIAKQMVDVAVEAGVDIIKFQTFKTERLVTMNAKKAQYQKESYNEEGDTQFKMLKKLELSEDDFIELKQYCKNKNIMFLSTPFDLESIDFLNNLDIDIWKIPSGEITNYPYLVHIARTKKKVILSTGMCTMEDIDDALKVLKEHGTSEITLLHCNTQYPTPMQDVNLLAIQTLRDTYQVDVGYSDHTLGIEVSIAAVALGATVIEKHFTLDKNMQGPDHRASLEPKELKAMVQGIRNIELALGIPMKMPTDSELSNRIVARKSIVASKKIMIGEKFTESNITTKRPGSGISAMRWNDVLGKTAGREYNKDELIVL